MDLNLRLPPSIAPWEHDKTDWGLPWPRTVWRDLFVDTKRSGLRSREGERYEALAAAVAGAIDEADPIGLLAMGAPRDEYSPEVGTIVPRVSRAVSVTEVKQILHEEFVRWFDMGIAGPVEAYDAPAMRIWEAVRRYQAG